MPPKKKGKEGDEEDHSTEHLVKVYRKKCEVHNAHYSKKFKEIVEEKMDNQEDVNVVC